MKKHHIKYGLITLLLAVIFSYLSLPIGISIQDSVNIKLFRNYYYFKGHVSKFPTIKLSIEDNKLQTLEKCRVKAINKGVLLSKNQKYVDAKLRFKNQDYDVKIKLKGTLSGHWKDPVIWSFRVVMNDTSHIDNNMKIFSIQSRNQRGHYIDRYYHTVLNHFGVLNLTYRNINFELNNMNLGAYAIEEFFDAPILKRMDRPNGVILKFAYDDYWRNANFNDPQHCNDTYEKTYLSSPIKAYKHNSNSYSNWKKDKKIASKSLKLFRAGKLRSRDVFDIDLMAKYFAINCLFGNRHPSFLTNLRFYYNPHNKLIEPIGYDMENIYHLKIEEDLEKINDPNKSRSLIKNIFPDEVSNHGNKFFNQLFSDTLLQIAFKRNLKLVADSSLIRSIIFPLDREFELIKKESFGIEDQRNFLYQNANVIKNKLEVEKGSNS